MGQEIERKFLVVGDAWREGLVGTPFRQGYLSTDPERAVRVRLAGDRAFLTIKGKSRGLSRSEFEYAIPTDEARQLLDGLCLKPLIEKTRYRIEYQGFVWEVDHFHGENDGLVMAEVELESERQTVPLPPWVGQEVSDDPRYFNAYLSQHPYRRW